MITKKWGSHTLHLERSNEGTVMLLEDLARALGMGWFELQSKIRDDFLIELYTEGDQDIPADSYTFVTRRGVYHAFLVAKTAEAIDFQNYVFKLIHINNFGPWADNFDLLDLFVLKEPDKSRVVWVYANILADAAVADRFKSSATPFFKLDKERLSYRKYIFPYILKSVKEDIEAGEPVRLPVGPYELYDPAELCTFYDLELRKREIVSEHDLP